LKTHRRKASRHTLIISPHPNQRDTLGAGIKQREQQMVHGVERLRVTTFGGGKVRRRNRENKKKE